MSLPNYLAKIKSAGIYRFVWDKSVVPPQQAETLRLLVGYSEKGPFNTPVYIDNIADFKAIYGNISKRLERRGVYFHRMAEQALQVGPILALNLKPFDKAEITSKVDGKDVTSPDPETVSTLSFGGAATLTQDSIAAKNLTDIYDKNRFWKLDADIIPAVLSNTPQYFNIVATDTKDASCSIIIKPYVNPAYSGITFKSWYLSQGLEMPEYLEEMKDVDMSGYFAKAYVFKGDLSNDTNESYYDKSGEGTEAKYTLKSTITDKLGQTVDTLDAMANDPNYKFIGVYTGCTLPYFKDANGNYISLDLKFNADYNSHKMLMKLNESLLDDMIGVTGTGKPTIADTTKVSASLFNKFIYLSGYTYKSIESGDNICSKCLEVLKTEGIRSALTNRVDVEYHYIIDTFDTEVNANKVELFALAKAKDNAFAIVNFPKMSKFTDSNPYAKYAMPSDLDGASFGAYYTQLTFSDGTVKSVIPSAALVSNNFMQKWGPRQPYYIVAGPNYGALSYSGLIGPDYNFSRADLDILEPKGVNAIVYVPRLGTYISSNQTAKQVPVSGLSKVHIRELVIYLQNEIEHLLQSYQWELNTQPLRDTIKAKADAICEKIMNNGGIYAFVNVCDETNNTPEVIDNEMIILDTEIEPARGAGKMVHQLTIHKTGGLTSSTK